MTGKLPPPPDVLRDLAALHTLAARGMNLVEVTISPVSVANGTLVQDLALPRNCLLIAVLRGDQLVYPRGNTDLRVQDRVLAVVDATEEDLLRNALTGLAVANRGWFQGRPMDTFTRDEGRAWRPGSADDGPPTTF